ncbi:MAG: hypothetical protein H7328_12430 [Bdellovibrio sp.]|nr:hypothetical protein [Bdellovibrio sp.]
MYLVKIILTTLLFAQLVFAQSEEEVSAADAGTKAYSGKQSSEWADVQKKLADAKAKLEAQDILVKNLIIEKSQSTGSEQNNKNEQIQVEHRKLQKMTDDYNLLRSDYETKFPEKGVKESRIYNRAEVKSIEGMQSDLTLEGRLNKLHNKVISQYPRSANPEPAVKKSSDAKNKKAIPAPAVKSEKEVTEQIILQK